ncbi:MAG: SDR family NAD(P)-dependent oxidoreductase [Pseudomonadales bacterium]
MAEQRLWGQVALVTGAASGIGRACAERLAAEGAKVLLTDIDSKAGGEAAEQINAAGGKATFFEHDVRDEQQWQAAIAIAEEQLGGLHVLVNNAGIGIGGSIIEMSLEDWQRQQAINLDGVFLGVKHGIPAMCRAGKGSIINISSVAGMKGSPRLAAYCATKGGVRLFSKAVALECGVEGWPVRVNSVHPGIIDTPIWTKVAPTDITPGANVVDLDDMSSVTALKRAGLPHDIANGVAFLASDESSYMTGTELVIDAGLCA